MKRMSKKHVQRNASPPLKSFIKLGHVSPWQQRSCREGGVLPGVPLHVPAPGLGPAMMRGRAVAGEAEGWGNLSVPDSGWR